MSADIDVVKMARLLGFRIDQIECDGPTAVPSLSWRWLAHGGIGELLEDAGQDFEQAGFNSDQDAAKQALEHLSHFLGGIVEGL